MTAEDDQWKTEYCAEYYERDKAEKRRFALTSYWHYQRNHSFKNLFEPFLKVNTSVTSHLVSYYYLHDISMPQLRVQQYLLVQRLYIAQVFLRDLLHSDPHLRVKVSCSVHNAICAFTQYYAFVAVVIFVFELKIRKINIETTKLKVRLPYQFNGQKNSIFLRFSRSLLRILYPLLYVNIYYKKTFMYIYII